MKVKDFNELNLKRLSELTSPDRAFVTIYLEDKGAIKKIEKKLEEFKVIVKNNPDELQYLEENSKMINSGLEGISKDDFPICIFACWVLEYLEIYSLPIPCGSRVFVDSSPFIKPIAEIRDDFEDFLVVVADNTSSRIYLVSGTIPEEEETVSGHIKNHVRKGGWSQQRYERRRDKQLLHYSKEIVEKIRELSSQHSVNRIILVGSWETIKEIEKVLPQDLKQKLAGEKALDIGKGEDYINKEVLELFTKQERADELEFWEIVKNRYLSGGLAVVGLEPVLKAAREFRIDKLIISENLKITGVRCNQCEHLYYRQPEKCIECGNQSFIPVDLAEEIIELVEKSSGLIEFTPEIPELNQSGGIAATLRF